MELASELQRIYDSEINLRIGWFWDGGITVRLGDEVNGFLAEETVPSIDGVLPWLQEAIAHFYPASTYAASLDASLKERAARRLFQQPRSGAQVICPHCGAPNATMMDEALAAICLHCGQPFEVQPPKLQ